MDPSAPFDEDPRRILNVPTLQNEEVPIELDAIWAEPGQEESAWNDIISMFDAEKVPAQFWIRLAEECNRCNRPRLALSTIDGGLRVVSYDERVPLLCMKATYLQALARKAPKTVLTTPRAGVPLTHSTRPDHPESLIRDPEAPPLIKEDYWNQAQDCLQQAERISPKHPVVLDCKGALLLARGRLDQANAVFDQILANEPTNLLALSGRGRCLYAKRSFRPALKAYQAVLTHAPGFLPDPRIGIGMCLYSLGDKERAKKAWERSIEVNPNSGSNTATLLLGLAHLNDSKNPTVLGGLEARAVSFEKGWVLVQQAFKQDNTSAAAAIAIGAHLLSIGQREKALKVAERAVQFADSRVLLAEGYLLVGRTLSQSGQDQVEALQEYNHAIAANPGQLQAQLAAAQSLVGVSQLPAAIDKYETILRQNPRCIEAIVALAAIHAQQAFTARSFADSEAERAKAKARYDDALKLVAIAKDPAPKPEDVVIAKSDRVRAVANDIEVYLEVAKLWADEANGERALNAYREAFQLAEHEFNEGAVTPELTDRIPKLLNNVGVLEFQRGEFHNALDKFQRALTKAGEALEGGVPTLAQDAVLTPTTFNIGTAHEAIGEIEQAKASYEQVLKQHPEYVDAKARLALMALTSDGPHRGQRLSYADQLLKESLTAFPASAELRALYTFFLVETGQSRAARDFARATLKEHNKHDLYALCAVGMLQYLDARELKGNERDRNDKFARAAEFYDKALSLQPTCAFAAHGLAVSIAENTIGTGAEAVAGQTAAQADAAGRAKNSRDALTVLMKVKESINDASVYINLGHVHFVREEFDRAIESYETALKRNKGKIVSTLLYLARGWYHKANKEKSFAGLRSALEACQKAAELRPEDLAIQFNIALIQQKGAELLTSVEQTKRTVDQLETAKQDNDAAIAIFERLLAAEAAQTPYPKDVADQRARYSRTLAKRLPDVLAAQQAYEDDEKARLAAALAAREAEKAAREEEMRQVLAEKEAREEAMREQRRLMKEEQAAIAEKLKAEVSEDEDKPKRARGEGGGKKRSKKGMREDGLIETSEEDGEGEEKRPKVKKQKKTKKQKKAAGSDEEDAMQVDRARVQDSEDEGPMRPKSKSKKASKFRTAEFIEDSDADSEEEAPAKETDEDE